MKKIFIYLFLVICIDTKIFADSCIEYKQDVKITLNQPKWEKNIIQPQYFMDKYQGNVEATFIDNYDINIEVMNVKGGFCVSLKEVNSIIGYKNFEIKIDKSHKKNTCSYNTILNHENNHVNAYLSLIKDNESYIYNAIYNSVNSIMPVFVLSDNGIQSVMDKFNKEIQKHPDIILMKQKIKAEEEIRNKKIDLYDDNKQLLECNN